MQISFNFANPSVARQDVDERLGELLNSLEAFFESTEFYVDPTATAAALQVYVGYGKNFQHLIRYAQGVLTLITIENITAGKGRDDKVGHLADTWDIAHSTLRLYTRAAKQTNLNIRDFFGFLTSGPRTSRALWELEAWCRYLDDPAITPTEAAKKIRSSRIDSALATVERTLEDTDDEEESKRLTVEVAGALGVNIVEVMEEYEFDAAVRARFRALLSQREKVDDKERGFLLAHHDLLDEVEETLCDLFETELATSQNQAA